MPERLPTPVPSSAPPTAPFVAVLTLGWMLAAGALQWSGAPADWQRTGTFGILIGLALLAVTLLRDRRAHR